MSTLIFGTCKIHLTSIKQLTKLSTPHLSFSVKLWQIIRYTPLCCSGYEPDIVKASERITHFFLFIFGAIIMVLKKKSCYCRNHLSLTAVSFVTELTDHIKVKASTREEDGESFSSFFPAFIWAVRDFTLDLKHEGRNITADEYLESALENSRGESVVV